MQHPTRNRKKKEKSVFDASHFEESDDSRSSGAEVKQVRFKRPSTPSHSSRSRTSKPITRYLPTLETISLVLLLLLVVSIPRFSTHFFSMVDVATNFTRPLIGVISSSLVRVPETQVPSHIADYVQQAISTALKSTVQRPDFASLSRGSIIVPSLTTSPLDLSCELEDVLDGEPDGRSCCFFAGDRGQIAIRLSQLIRPTHITIDYTPPTRTMSHHAPRRMVLWGLIDGAANKALFKSLSSLSQFREQQRSLGDGPSQSGNFVFLPFADFTFDVNAGFPIQTFPAHSDIVFSRISSGLYVLEIRSNWEGNSTGICRVRLHGEEAV